MAQLGSVTCHMGSHNVTCHPTQVITSRLLDLHIPEEWKAELT